MSQEITLDAGTKIKIETIPETPEITSAGGTELIPLTKDGVTNHISVNNLMEPVIQQAKGDIIGSALPTDSPSGTETVGQSYRVSNTKEVPDPDDGSNDDTYTNFLTSTPDGSGGYLPVVVPASTSGLIVKNAYGWFFIKDETHHLVSIDFWTARKYQVGEQCIHNGNLYAAKDWTTAASDEPGISPLWRPVVAPLIRLNNINENATGAFRLDNVPYTDLNNQFLSLFDRSIREINMLNSDYRYVSLKQISVTVNDNNTALFNCILTLSYSLNAGDNKDLNIITGNTTVSLDNRIARLYFKDNTSTPRKEEIEMVIDTAFFKVGTTYNWSFAAKKDGLLNDLSITTLKAPEGFPIGHDSYNTFTGAQFALFRALKNITCWGNIDDKTFRFVRLDRSAGGDVTIDVGVDSNGSQISLLRSVIAAADFTGIYNDSMGWGGSGTPNRDYGITITLDCDAITRHFPAGAFSIKQLNDGVFYPKRGDYKRVLLSAVYDISKTAGYPDYRGLWYANGSYVMNDVGIKIPEGTTAIDYVNGGMDLNANVLFGDKNGQMVGYGWTDDDGVSKYSGAEVKNNMTMPVLDNYNFVLASTLKANAANFRLYAIGDFKDEIKTDFRSIHDCILDHLVPDGVYNVGQMTIRKNGTDLNSVQVLDGNDLARVDTFTYKGEFIQGSHTGQLVNYKNGLRYFFNGQTNRIYTQDGQDNEVILFDQTTHPDVWNTALQQGNGRTVLEVMEDGSILFDLLIGEDDGNRHYCLYKLKADGTLVKCFNYSNEYYHKDWLDDTDPQYNQPGWANGAPNGSWSFAYGEGLIFATEYGAGTSKYWAENNPALGGNARGIPSRVWCSNNDGDTWYKILDLTDKINPLNGEADDNWVYWTSTAWFRMHHIHGISYDIYGRRLMVTNGDGQNYIWHINIDDIIAFLETATPVDPDEFPVSNTPTPTWDSFLICEDSSIRRIINYNAMALQFVAFFAFQQGVAMIHDAPRECQYFIHRKGIEDNDLNIEPTYFFERASDFDTANKYRVSQSLTDGFVLNMVRFSKSDPVLITHSAPQDGKYVRIWATYNGIEHKAVLECEEHIITFGCRIFQHESGDLMISTGGSTGSYDAGYYLVRKNRNV